MKLHLFFITTIMLLFFSGCSKYQSVSGKVTYTDGSPVTVGQVAFENGEFVARAYIDVQGNYRMGRIKDGDGISPGIYKVFLYDANIYEEPSGGGSSIVKPQVNAKYANPDSSGLTCEVKGKTVFNFKVEKP